ncbi:MAG: efflux RND transporter periplasmic adaptor subunit, partial [Gammaproteobacteria bacterium]|nr:efflux RND transporter periplasmic adaptor subunit [Gammaproteobacteria bacterium]
MNNEYQLNVDNQSKSSEMLTRRRAFAWRIPRKVRIVLSIVLLTAVVVVLLNVFKPEAQKRAIPETVVRVDVIEASLSSYPIVVTANGTIEAETRGNLVAQIRGEIVSMSENFKTGGAFQKGDVLIQIDPRDYQADLSQALASLSQADAAYRQELANAKQALEDWKRLGNNTPAPDLVQRKPQLAAAKAALDSARASHETAKLNLSRTKITAPYAGRIIRRDAVLGQYVGVGTPIAEVFSTDGVEVRLPISQDEYAQLGLDKLSATNTDGRNFAVVLSSTVGGKENNWSAKIVRTDSTFDINTRQIDVIAEVDDPFGRESGQLPLKIGQFVSASIKGRVVDNVYVIPNKSVREGRYAYVARDGIL